MGIITQKTHHVCSILAVRELWQPYMDYNEKILGFGRETETAILAVLLYMYTICQLGLSLSVFQLKLPMVMSNSC